MIEKSQAFVPPRRFTALLLMAISLAGATGCSSVPDAVNPVEWYRGASGLFESDADQAQRDQAAAAKETAPSLPGTDKAYPNLSTVPERPRSVLTAEERNRVAKSLAADRENARYAEPEPNRPSGAALGAPTAVPRAPVTTVPAGPSRDSLEPLPPEVAPPPAPQSSRDEPQPGSSLAAENAVEQSSVAVSPALAAQTVRSEPIAAAPPASLVEQTYSAAIEQQAIHVAAAPQETPPAGAPPRFNAPPATAPRTAAGTPIARSYVVHFRGGTTQLDAAAKATVQDVARLYKSANGSLRIVGHASRNTRERDPVAERMVNLRISTERAESVANELARLGVPRAVMTVVGAGDSEPIYQETTQSGVASNRRVEIFFGS